MSRHGGGMLRLEELLCSASAHASAARSTLFTCSVDRFLCGAVRVEESEGGWVRPYRLGPSQARSLESCLAWHPGLYRQMARTTAGVCLRFVTDGSELAMAVRVDEEPSGTAAALAPLDSGRRRLHDGFAVMVDGRQMGCLVPRELGRPLPWMEDAAGSSLLTFALEKHARNEARTMAIPGLGARHEVCVWLPCLRGCEVRELWTDGTFVEPVAARGRLLVLGDTVGQGFSADDPLLTWPALLSEHLGLELINQSIRRQVFQPSALMGEWVSDVRVVVVELGGAYRDEACSESAVTQDVRAYLRELAAGYPDARVVVITPLGHDALRRHTHPSSCARAVARILRSEAHRQGMEVVEGLSLVGEGDGSLLVGECLLPVGHVQLASRLAAALE